MLRILDSESDLEQLSSDAGIIKIRPQGGYAAETEEDVVSVFKEAERRGLSITARGAGTSIPSQAVGRGIVLLQERRMAKISQGWKVVCQPGLVKAELNKLLESAERWMPVDPSSYQSCTVGGMVSNNSSGIRTPKYGSTIDYVEKMRVVIHGESVRPIGAMPVEAALSGDPKTRRVAELIVENWGAIAREKPRVSKNSSGYRLERVLAGNVFDLSKLFVGSEGTLGVVTEVEFKTLVRPKWRVLLALDVDLDELDSVVAAFSEHSPTSIELLDKSVFKRMKRTESIGRYSRNEEDYLLFCEFDDNGTDADTKLEDVSNSRAGRLEPMVLTDPSEVSRAWGVRNEILTLALEVREGKKALLPGVEDLVVPRERLADLVRLLRDTFERRGLTYISYGHAADANLHARPLLDPGAHGDRRILDEIMEECFEAVWKMGGSMTGEHGDGMLRAPYLNRQYPNTYQVMKEIKEVYDPKGILNPGVKLE